jgi:hypothetical protein
MERRLRRPIADQQSDAKDVPQFDYRARCGLPANYFKKLKVNTIIKEKSHMDI